jgi:hypothetical protein
MRGSSQRMRDRGRITARWQRRRSVLRLAQAWLMLRWTTTFLFQLHRGPHLSIRYVRPFVRGGAEK